jgi:hypothetical protein
MEDVKIQLSTENIQYKKKLDISFANLVNTLIEECQRDSVLESKILATIAKKQTNNFKRS